MKIWKSKRSYMANVNYDYTLAELFSMANLRIHPVDLMYFEDHCSKKEEPKNAKKFIRICFGKITSTATILKEFEKMKLRVPTVKEALSFHIKHPGSNFLVLDRILGDGLFQGKEARHRPWYMNFIEKRYLSGILTFQETPHEKECWNYSAFFLAVKE